MKHVTFCVQYPSDLLHPLHEALADTEGLTRAELLFWGPTEAVTTLSWFDGGERAVEAVLAAVESTRTSHLVAGDGGTYAFVHQTDYEFAAPILDLLGESQVVFPPPVTFLEGRTIQFAAVGDSRAVSEFHDALGSLGEVRIERVEPYGRGPAATTMTERQREALESAVSVGYYDRPRSGSLADVARELDCARSTAGELVRKGEESLVTAFVESSNRFEQA